MIYITSRTMLLRLVCAVFFLVFLPSGTLLAEYSYDPWGCLRDPQTLAPQDTASQAVPIIGGRGYTGHEHLPVRKHLNKMVYMLYKV